MKKKSFLLIIQLLLLNSVNAQLTVSTAMTPTQLVQNVLIVNGVIVSNVTYSGITGSIGNFNTGASPTNLGLTNGIIISTGLVNDYWGIGSPVSNFASNTNGTGSDPDLQALLPGYTINDAAVLQFDFVTVADTVKFRYVFASEEYPEWVGSICNDAFGLFITGINPLGGNYNSYNIALLPDTMLPITIDNVNSGFNSIYYVDNQGLNGQTIVFDGFTTVLTAWCLVQPCMQYHIKIAIGDAGDSAYDSGIFLEAHSFYTGIIYSSPEIDTNASDQVACSGGNASFSVSASALYSIYYQWQISTDSGNNWVNITAPDTMPVYSGFTSDHLTLTNIPDSCNGNLYRCLISDSTCMPFVTSANAELFVTNVPPLTGSISGDAAVCQGQDSVMYFIPFDVYATTYTWTLPQGSYGSSNSNSIIVNYSDTAISGDITVYGVNDCGNGTVETLHINIYPKLPAPTITQNGSTLISSTENGYQWYYNGAIIPGATSQTFTMSNPGNYQVEVYNSFGCSSISEIIYWSSMEEQINENAIEIYPNPAIDQIIISYHDKQNMNLSLYSIEGKLLLQQSLRHDKTVINISILNRGIYIVRVLGTDINVTKKIIKQ